MEGLAPGDVPRQGSGPAPGRVEALLVAPSAGAPMRRLPSVGCDGLRGLEGDRYAVGRGHWSHHRWEPVTLVAVEVLEVVSRVLGRPVDPETVRRNVVTRGIDLGTLRGRTFRIGRVTLRGTRPCAPCRYLEGLAGLPGLKEALAGRGGLRAVLLSGGTLRVGDPVGPLPTKSLVDSGLAGS